MSIKNFKEYCFGYVKFEILFDSQVGMVNSSVDL